MLSTNLATSALIAPGLSTARSVPSRSLGSPLWDIAGRAPSLDLNLAQNKNLLDSVTGQNLVTFTRASTGTYVGSDGLIKTAAVNEARFDHNTTTGESLGLLVEEQRTNLLRWSEDSSQWLAASNASLTQNAAIAPDGRLTADQMLETTASGLHSQEVTDFVFVQGATYTYSVFVKAVGGRNFEIGFPTPNFSSRFARFNLSTGTVQGTDAGVTASIAAFPNGWYRCSATSVCSTGGGARPSHFINNASFSRNYVGEAGKGVVVWGIQLEAGDFATSYISTLPTFVSRASTATFFDANGVLQTAGVNVARSSAFQPDSSGVMRSIGLLVEEQRTNLLQWSQDSSQWLAASNASLTQNAATAPDGTATADQMLETTASGLHSQEVTSFVFVQGTTYTYSVFVRPIGGRNFEIGFPAPIFSNRFARFNLSTGVVQGTDAGVTASITAFPNGWYRCSATSVCSTGGGARPSHFINNASFSRNYVGEAGKGVVVWGIQLEAGDFATSYIPTTSSAATRSADVTNIAAATRSADVASITGTAFSSWYRQDEGTFYGDAQTEFAVTAFPVIVDGRTSSTDIVQVGYVTEPLSVGYVRAGNSDQAVMYNTGLSGVRRRRVACGMAANNFGVATNGGSIVSDSSGTMPTNIASVFLGSVGGSSSLNGAIRRLTYWPARLANSTLQSITA